MTLAATGVARSHRPFPVYAITVLLTLLGVGAIFGGWGLGSGSLALPDEYVEMLPLVNSWVVPGLVLGIGFGLGSLFVLYGVARRPRWHWLGFVERATGHHWSWIGVILLGGGHVVWIGIEVVSIPFSFLMPIFGVVGLALATLPFLPSVRQYLSVEPTPQARRAVSAAHARGAGSHSRR